MKKIQSSFENHRDIFKEINEELDLASPEHQQQTYESLDAKLRAAVDLLATRIASLPPSSQTPELEPRAMLVGGFVRDTLLQKKPKDADVEVYGVDAERLEQLLDQLFPDEVNKVGKAFGILKISIGDGLDLDVSIPRSESKMPEESDNEHTNFIINGDPSMSVKEAARRRDFSFNALAMDPLTGRIEDPFGGVEDLQNKVLRVTDPERFQDDPLRVLRAVQFVARMDLRVEPESFRLMKEMVDEGRLDKVKKERVVEEIKKLMLKSEKPSVGWKLARELGIVEKYFPELHALIDVPQEPEWHPEGDVWIHTMMVVDAAAKIIQQSGVKFSEDEKMQTMMGALCHDLGKALTTEEIDGKIRSLGHEEAGVKPTQEMLGRLKFGGKIIDGASIAAAEHLKCGVFFRDLERGKLDERSYTNVLRKLVKRIHPVSWEVLVAVSEADHRGRALPEVDTHEYTAGERLASTIRTKKLDEEPTKPLVGGKDIIHLSGKYSKSIKPGPVFRDLIRAVEKMRDSGEIVTRGEGLNELEKLIIEL